MKMNKITKVLMLFIAFVASTSCINEKLEVTYNKQEDNISKYIDNALGKNSEATFVRNGGSNRLISVQGEGEELLSDGNITFYYAGYIFDGSVNPSKMFTTNRLLSANDAGWSLTDADYEALTINLKDEKLLPGLRSGLVGVKAGEECEILFSGKYGFGRRDFGIIPANSALLYKIWVISISNE